MRKIIEKMKAVPAAVLVLLSFVIMTSSTYAWFSMNARVNATNMEIISTVKGGLSIASYTMKIDGSAQLPKDSDFGESSSSKAKVMAELKPTSFNGSDWHGAIAANSDSFVADSSTYKMIDSKYLNEHRLISKFQIKATGPDANLEPSSLFVDKIIVTGNSNSIELNRSLRMVIGIDGKFFYFAPLYSSVSGGILYYYNGSSRAAKSVDSDIYINNSVLAEGIMIANKTITSTPTDIDIYLYYEGEDENCNTLNAINIDELEVSISFTSDITSKNTKLAVLNNNPDVGMPKKTSDGEKTNGKLFTKAYDKIMRDIMLEGFDGISPDNSEVVGEDCKAELILEGGKYVIHITPPEGKNEIPTTATVYINTK